VSKATEASERARGWAGWGVCVLATALDLQQLVERMKTDKGARRSVRRVAALARRVERVARELMREDAIGRELKGL
jgi:hypothetical protein